MPLPTRAPVLISTAIAFALLALPTAARSADRWGDGLTGRAPDSAFAGGGATWVPGRDTLLFGDLRGGGPLYRSDHRPFALGLAGSLSTSSLWTSDGRTHHGIRNGGLDLWVMHGRDDPDDLTSHALVVGFHRQLEGTETSWFLATPNEVAPWLLLAYDAYIDRDGFDLSFEGRTGLGGAIPLDVTWTAVVLVEAGEDLAVGAGGTVGLLPFGTAIATARYRPVDGVEISVGASLPIPLFEPDRTRITVRPTAQIELFL
jgi:hypothetical protein